jgi:type II secretory pathway pseudopilin PulG
MKNFYIRKRGMILINALVFAVVAVTVTTALVNWGATTLKNSKQLSSREQAFQIAEAGIDYYRWHLAHNQTDYTDGNATTTTGPFVHDFKDKDGNVIGNFALTITPPPVGSTVVKIKSKGSINDGSGVVRSIEAKLAIPSLAKYAVAANDVMRFGEGTEVFGPIHSNNGIRFDGLAHNIISSSKDKYIDPDNGNSYRFGVYTTVGTDDPNPPAAVPSRPDVFMAGRQFPLQTFDFSGMTTDLSQMKTSAQTDGKYFAASGAQGYHVKFKTNDTFDLYKVTAIVTPGNKCTNGLNQTNWGSWSINTETFVANYPNPNNGIIFLEDNVWVDGQINTARITLAAGKFPDNVSTRKSITINNDLLYSNYDGSDVISLIAQDNINVGLISDDTLRIDAALVAQNGRAGRYYYSNSGNNSNSCQNYHVRNSITLYGMIATNLRYGFAYTDGTGYQDRNIVYDSNLLYAPPPSFPLTSNQYSVISWEEVK